MRLRGPAIFAAVITAIFAVAVGLAVNLPPAARLLPLIIGIPGVILGLLAVRKERQVNAEAKDRNVQRSAEERRAIVWVAGFWLAILLFGFRIGAPLVTMGYLGLALRQRPAAVLAGGVSCFLLTYGLFERLFGVPLFHGLLLP